MKYKLLILAIAAVVMTTACKKEQLVTTNASPTTPAPHEIRSSDSIVVNNQRLKFKDIHVFINTMTNLNSMEYSAVRQWRASYTFPSLATHYDAIDADSTSVGLDSLFRTRQLLTVPDYRFASILNKQGQFQIGDSIHVIKQDIEYVVTNGDESIITNEDWTNAAVISNPIRFDLTWQVDRHLNGPWYGWHQYERYTDDNNVTLPKTNNNRPTKFQGSRWNVSYLAYCSTGIRGKYQKKTTLAGWQPENASSIYLEGEFIGERIAAGYPTINVQATEPLGVSFNNNIRDKTLLFFAGTVYTYFKPSFSHLWTRATYKGKTATVNQ